MPVTEIELKPGCWLEADIARARQKAAAESQRSWDQRWLDLAGFVSQWSKDRSRKTCAVVVNDRNTLLTLGWNGFPRGVRDKVNARHTRPDKYLWTEHAERNAIYNAAAEGIRLRGATMYLPWYPCADCARAIIQAGIVELVAVEPDWNDETYALSFLTTRKMLEEARIIVRWVQGFTPPVRV